MNTINQVVARSAKRMKAQQKIQNTSVVSGSGALGPGDRGSFSFLPFNSGNPYNYQDYVTRWRQYVQMYETCWEARKIVRIIPEDALRKEWLIEDISEEMITYVKQRSVTLQFLSIMKRSLILERLLGGCLLFMGIQGTEEDLDKPFHPSSTVRNNLIFCNAIPLSRIARVDWCQDPLSEHYMRPEKYLINGSNIHVSRCLVWDGEPLFDPYDYALTNFRSNLAGFGESKLATVWDDVIKAVGTRQAAYQLIETNNAIIMAVQDLQDLQGTKTGKQALAKLQEIANQISVYRAAMVDGDKVTITQQSASFGSVPELMMMFLQVLSAASDIPATRFIGQAPGGLNATGDSDLENYYNVIDAYQQQRIVPNIRRFYDILLYPKFGGAWDKEREKLSIKFPPLWNQSELEQAQQASAVIDNVLKLVDRGLMGDEKAINEINTKGVLSVKLDTEDIQVMEEANPLNDMNHESVNPQTAITALKNSVYFSKWQGLVRAAGYAPEEFDINQVIKGFGVEQEHADVTQGNDVETMKIVMAHLTEKPDYYDMLEKVENTKIQNYITESNGKFIVHAESGKKLGEYDSKSEAEKRLKQIEYFKHQNSIDLDLLPEPTDSQKLSGNYKKHHIKLHGLDFAIENPKGSFRKGIDENGKRWSSELPAHYGYIKKTEGADGDHVDAYVGPNEDSELVFIVDQKDHNTGEFDEHKCIFGCLSMAQAMELYCSSFSDGKGKERLGSLSPLHVLQFKEWLQSGDTTKPYKGGE